MSIRSVRMLYLTAPCRYGSFWNTVRQFLMLFLIAPLSVKSRLPLTSSTVMLGCGFCKSLFKFHHLFSLLGNQSFLIFKTKLVVNFLRLLLFIIYTLYLYYIRYIASFFYTSCEFLLFQLRVSFILHTSFFYICYEYLLRKILLFAVKQPRNCRQKISQFASNNLVIHVKFFISCAFRQTNS